MQPRGARVQLLRRVLVSRVAASSTPWTSSGSLPVQLEDRIAVLVEELRVQDGVGLDLVERVAPAGLRRAERLLGVGDVAGAEERRAEVELHDRVARVARARAARARARPPSAAAARRRRAPRPRAATGRRGRSAARGRCLHCARRLGRILARRVDDAGDDSRRRDGEQRHDQPHPVYGRHIGEASGKYRGASYRFNVYADLSRAAPADEVRDLGDRRARRAGARRRGLDRRARGRRVAGGPPPRCGARSARLSREPRSRRSPPTSRSRSSSTARRRTARPSPRRRCRSSATRTSTRSPAASRTGSATGSRSSCRARSRPEKRTRYSRHLLIPEIGEEGQLKLLDAKILLIGAGGLGSPAALYLAAAGIGTLGIVDADIVDETNLQRQIAHSLDTLGTPKVDSAKRAIQALNPDVEVVTYRERLTSENIDRILDDGWDLILDGADNFPTRYLVNDASVWRGIPGRARVDLPLRGPGDGVQAARRPVLPLPLPGAAAARARAVLLRGRRARHPPRHRRLAADERGDQARRRDRRARSSAGCCSSTRSRRSSTR